MHPSALELVSAGAAGSMASRTRTIRSDSIIAGMCFAAWGSPDAPRTFGRTRRRVRPAARPQGIEPIAIGTRDLWPAAAWFDYLDLRQNGLAFHMALMQGKVAYTDPRVRAVFERWRELARPQLLQSQPRLVELAGEPGAALPGQGGHDADRQLHRRQLSGRTLRDRMEFARFPALRPDVGRFEEAPMNTVHVPARARNKDEAKRFLAFVMRADVQEATQRTTAADCRSTNAAGVADDRFLAAGQRAHPRARRVSRSTSTATRARISPTSR